MPPPGPLLWALGTCAHPRGALSTAHRPDSGTALLVDEDPAGPLGLADLCSPRIHPAVGTTARTRQPHSARLGDPKAVTGDRDFGGWDRPWAGDTGHPGLTDAGDQAGSPHHDQDVGQHDVVALGALGLLRLELEDAPLSEGHRVIVVEGDVCLDPELPGTGGDGQWPRTRRAPWPAARLVGPNATCLSAAPRPLRRPPVQQGGRGQARPQCPQLAHLYT